MVPGNDSVRTVRLNPTVFTAMESLLRANFSGGQNCLPFFLQIY
jgi:hypothetical protein